MKAIPIILAVVVFSATLAHLITRSHFSAKLAALETQEPSGTDKAQMRTAKNRTKYALGRTEIIEHTITETVAQDPAEVLKQLEAIEPGKQDRNPKLRKVVHYLETLTKLGTESLAAIDDYLATGQDVSYGSTYSRSFNVRGATNQNLQNLTIRIQGATDGQAKAGGPQPAVRTYNYFSSTFGSPSAGYLVPPSLRMGLFQVVSEINGGVAEKLLADSLGMTQKGVEAAFLDLLLHKMAPDQYKSLALSVAKDLLLNPTEESLKDYQHKTHLYSILTRHRDLDFAQDAQELLIDADGKLDRFALNYLTTVLKADVVPMLAKAHDDPNIKSQWERQSLLSYIMRYVGMHPGADEFFKKIMSQPVEQTGTTSYYQSPQYKALSYLSYNADQETATKRKVLLESVRPSVTDEKLKSLLDSTGRRLDYRINPKTYQWKGKSGSGGGAAIEGRQLFFNQGGGGLLLQGSGPDGQSSTIRILPAGGKKQSLPRRGPAIEHNHVRRLVFVAAQPEVLALFADARED